MICPYCKKEGRKSRLTPGRSFVTSMGWTHGYYDEDGKWTRNEDPNYRVTDYSCSNGHNFEVTRVGKKAWIGPMFAKEEERIYIDWNSYG